MEVTGKFGVFLNSCMEIVIKIVFAGTNFFHPRPMASLALKEILARVEFHLYKLLRLAIRHLFCCIWPAKLYAYSGAGIITIRCLWMEHV
jgi:hypothetical protein